MRSLKIIIFRDTDKPYTLILSPGILIGSIFGLITLVTVLTFSVMSNVMLYPRVETVIAATDENNEENQGDIETRPVEEDDTTGAETGEQIADNQDEVSSDEAESTETEEITGENELTAEEAGSESLVTSFRKPGAVVETTVLGNVSLNESFVSLRVQVRKIDSEMGTAVQGRFAAALMDKDGNISSTYPENLAFSGIDLIDPARANSFRIRYRRDYNLRLATEPGKTYSSIILYIYHQESGELLMREVVPIAGQ